MQQKFDLALENGRVFTEGSLKETNVAVLNGKISAIARGKFDAVKKIDCSGKIILPGLIDVHVHFREPGFEQKEDWLTGSKAALHGGVTTVLDMPNNNPPITSVELLEKKREIAAKKSMVNFGFYLGATPDNLAEFGKAKNIAGIKVFTGSSTGSLLVDKEKDIESIFSAAAKAGKLVAIHAEDNVLIQENEKKAKKEKLKDPEIHSLIRNGLVEESAVKLVLKLQRKTNARIHFCHISARESIPLLEKQKNELISAEVTPHHLFLTSSYARYLGNKCKVNPALHFEADKFALWKALNEGIIDIVATDHAPHLLGEKEKDYWDAPSGMPGIETMLPLMLNAFSQNIISLSRLVEACCENPARLFRIKGKGLIKEGFDADLTVVDLRKKWRVSSNDLFTKCKWSAFEGLELKGVVEKTIVSGSLLFDSGQILNEGFKGKEVEFR